MCSFHRYKIGTNITLCHFKLFCTHRTYMMNKYYWQTHRKKNVIRKLQDCAIIPQTLRQKESQDYLPSTICVRNVEMWRKKIWICTTKRSISYVEVEFYKVQDSLQNVPVHHSLLLPQPHTKKEEGKKKKSRAARKRIKSYKSSI